MESGLEVVKIELDDFDLSEHVDTAIDFMPPSARHQKLFLAREIRSMMRLYSRKLLKAMIDYQNHEYEIIDEDNDEDNHELVD